MASSFIYCVTDQTILLEKFWNNLCLQVNGRIKEREGYAPGTPHHRCKEMSEFTSSLCKDLYLFPKYQPQYWYPRMHNHNLIHTHTPFLGHTSDTPTLTATHTFLCYRLTSICIHTFCVNAVYSNQQAQTQTQILIWVDCTFVSLCVSVSGPLRGFGCSSFSVPYVSSLFLNCILYTDLFLWFYFIWNDFIRIFNRILFNV